ncbi:MAG TPA: hypothetical protein VHS57_07530 [Acidimicrobiales bacterium]|nr:hypothetical protein [Acidimicrobiales bacterium]
MEVVRFFAFLAGVGIVLGTVWNLFSALVLPRVTSSRIFRAIARMLGGSARRLSPRLPTYELRDRILSFVGPGSIVLLFGLWLLLILLGFSLIIWWDSGTDFASAVGIAGSSAFTLGILSAGGAGPHTLEILAAGFGLLVVALEIAYLPALYNAFAVRETEVTLLDARGGNPAWGPEILARHFWLDTMDELPPLYAQWERWAAAVSESHANYPGLVWFRSPVSTRSWLLGLVAILDAAALHHSSSPTNTPHQARLCLSMGIRCLRSVANAWHIPFDPDPLPDALVRLTRGEFEDGYRRLEEVNFPLERDAEESWKNFQGWRVNYEPIVDALTELIVPPPAPWFVARTDLVGSAVYPLVLNRTPDEPAGAKGYGKSKTFKTPSLRESKSS